MIAAAPAFAISIRPSGNGKNASEAAMLSFRSCPNSFAFDTAIFVESILDG
ncbi:MAG: hypothetical protein R3A12_10675 [Ignavibacteria bacterium]